MAWAVPPTFVANNVLTAAQMNLIGDDLVYLKSQTDFLVSVSGQTNQTVTIAPVGGNTKVCFITGYVWNETGSAVLGALIQTFRVPGGASIASTTGGDTVTIVFNANGSITVSRTAGTATWGLRLLVVFG